MKPCQRRSRTFPNLLGAGILILVACAIASNGQESSPAEASAEEGKKAYGAVGCQRCHGPNGQDGTEGPALAPDPIPFAEFSAVVRGGRGGGMPAYDTSRLSDSELEAIYAFLKTVN